MTSKKNNVVIQSKDLIKENYIPSETERKRVVVYYFLVGILLALSGKYLSKYEYYHLKQAIGWWVIFFVVFVISSFFMILPFFVSLIPWLVLVSLIGVWVFFIVQAWQGKYTVEINGEEKVLFAIFAGIGNWLLNLFDKKFEIKE